MTGRLRRAFLPSAAPDARIELDQEESHHVARVLRARAGDGLSVFDGRGGEWQATVEAIAGDRVTVRVGAPVADPVEPPLRVVLHQALVRPEKLEWVLQKGTEVGISSFRLLPTERGERVPSDSRLARYGRITLEACKQSGRRIVPEVELAASPERPGGGVIALVLDTSTQAPALASALAGPAPAEVWIAVGPEGGWTEDELSGLEALGWRRVSLGPRTLRTETAGAVAAAIVLHAWGDLGV